MDETVQALKRASFASMKALNPDDLLHDIRPMLVVHKDGRVQRFIGPKSHVPSGVDPLTKVESKDVVVSQETGVFVRLYKPPGLNPDRKVPLLVYFHGGGFCSQSTASSPYHMYLNSLCSKADVMVASVEYRLAPEFPLPTAYDDSWSAIELLAGDGEPWLRDHADCSQVFFGGDSAGANIAHNMAKRIKKRRVPNWSLKGIVLVHPYFWTEELELGVKEIKEGGLPSRRWRFVCPGTSGLDDPLINPEKDPDVGELSCDRVLVAVAEKDVLRDGGMLYKETLEKSAWGGTVEVLETPGEDHVFHLMKPSSATATELMDRVVQFLDCH